MSPIIWIVILIILVPAAIAGISAAPWVPMRGRDIDRVMDFIRVKAGDVFWDLGCGDGRLCLAVAKREPQADVRGVELSLLPFLWSKCSAILQRVSNVRIRWGNLFSVDLSDTDIVYFFLTPKAMERMKKKIEKEAKINVRVFSYVFPVPGWTPVSIDKPTADSVVIYEYAPRNVGGA